MDSSVSAIRLALLAMGIEDAEEMSNDELLAYASSLNISLEDINMLNNPNLPTLGFDIQDSSNVTVDYLNTGYLAENDDMHLSNLEYHTPVTDTPIMSTMENNDGNTLQNDVIVSNFCGITGCDTANAQQYLEAFGFDFETAIAVYMDSIDQNNSSNTISSSASINPNNQIQPPAPGPTRSNILESTRLNIQGSAIPISTRNTINSSSNTSTNHQRFFESFLNNDDSDRLPPSPFMGALREMMESNDNISANHIRQFMEFGRQINDDDDNNYMREDRSLSKFQDEYDEHGIRRPDPVQRQQLLGGHDTMRMSRRGIP